MTWNWGRERVFYYLSTDTKPDLHTDDTGSFAIEVDTGKHYYWNGSAWIEKIDRRHQYVWDTVGLAWVALEQPIIATDTLNVTLSGVATAANQTSGGQKTQIVDTGGTTVEQFGVDDRFPTGSGTNGTLTLTLADTAYSITVGAGKCILAVYNGSDTDVFWGFATLTSGGVLLPAGGTLIVNLGASQVLYFYCEEAGKVLNYSYKLSE